MQLDTPVLIVGGGPIGLATALELASRGIRSVLVEQDSRTAPVLLAKAGTLNATDLKAGTLPQDPTKNLAAGKTIRGFLNGDFTEPVSGGDWRVSAGFPVPLAVVPQASFLVGGLGGGVCTGTFLDPTAPADTLCVYVDAAANPNFGVSSHDVQYVTRFGFSVGWNTQTTGDTLFAATWAYTEG